MTHVPQTHAPFSRTTLRSLQLAPVVLAVLSALSAGARADELDTFQFKLGQSFQHDSNVFRLSDSTNAQALIGTNERSDTVAVTTAGFKINKPIGLQRFEFEIEGQNYKYSRFSRLDFTAVNYAAAWRWSLTPSFHGNLTTDRREYVDTNADVQGQGRVNRRTERSSLLDAEYELGAAWRLVGGVFERNSTNSQPFTFEADSRVRGAEAGVRYVVREDTSIAYRYRSGRGSYSSQPLLGLASRDFDDREHEVRFNWQATGKTAIQGRLSHLKRKHDSVSARDFSGVLGEVTANWAITGKTTLTGGLVEELGSYQTNNESYYDGYRVFLAPVWKPTEKTAVRLRYDHGVRDYKGPLPGFAASGRRDTTRIASLGLEWQVVRSLTLQALFQREKRTSNVTGFDYRNNSVLVSGVLSF